MERVICNKKLSEIGQHEIALRYSTPGMYRTHYKFHPALQPTEHPRPSLTNSIFGSKTFGKFGIEVITLRILIFSILLMLQVLGYFIIRGLPPSNAFHKA